jgi:dihydroorotate dehydrogenase
MARMTRAFPDREFSGIGGISGWTHALNYILLGCGTVQVATAAMLDHAIGPNVIRDLTDGMTAFLDRHADRGWSTLADFRGLRRGNIVAQSQIGRPESSEYHGGYQEEAEGYAAPVPTA